MKRTKILATFLGIISLLSTGCGTSDKIGSVSMQVVGASGAGVVDLKGLGGTLQLAVSANYTSGKIIDQTHFATYTVTAEGVDNNTKLPLPAPPMTFTINSTGMITAVDPAVCTWFSTTGDPKTGGWAFTGDYKIVATYHGFSSNPVFIPIASAASNQANMQGQCGP